MANMHEMGDFQTAQTLETFGFLPKFTQDEIYEQIAYIIAQGWAPAIEHEHPSRAFNHYWTMWKLPFFGEQDLGRVIAEMEACRRSYPDHHIRVIGYDNYTQSQGAAFVAYEGRS
jgi:ribulose-bisphosphate carboxylase small chain